jgi:transcriptional regulator with XRE-family HTH domain
LNIDYKTIGLRLKQVRGNTSQKDLASQFQLSNSYVNNVEHGSKPSLEFLINVASHFNVSLDWLILGIGQAQSLTVEEDSLRNELLQIFDALTPEGQSILLGTVKTVMQHALTNNSANTSTVSVNTVEE